MQWSFMSESRRLDNTRMKRELRLRLRYPTVSGIARQCFGLPNFPTCEENRHALGKGLSHRFRGQLVRRPVLPAAHFRQSGHGAGRQRRRARAPAADGAQALSLRHADRRCWRSHSGSGCGSAIGFAGGWLHAKTALVVGLVAYHVWCGRLLAEFARGRSTGRHVWFRFFNEVPVLVLVAICILVVVKPF